MREGHSGEGDGARQWHQFLCMQTIASHTVKLLPDCSFALPAVLRMQLRMHDDAPVMTVHADRGMSALSGDESEEMGDEFQQ